MISIVFAEFDVTISKACQSNATSGLGTRLARAAEYEELRSPIFENCQRPLFASDVVHGRLRFDQSVLRDFQTRIKDEGQDASAILGVWLKIYLSYFFTAFLKINIEYSKFNYNVTISTFLSAK